MPSNNAHLNIYRKNVYKRPLKVSQKNSPKKSTKIGVQLYFYKLSRVVLINALVASTTEVFFLLGFFFMVQASCFVASAPKITSLGWILVIILT